jgi:hypothetical protein
MRRARRTFRLLIERRLIERRSRGTHRVRMTPGHRDCALRRFCDAGAAWLLRPASSGIEVALRCRRCWAAAPRGEVARAPASMSLSDAEAETEAETEESRPPRPSSPVDARPPGLRRAPTGCDGTASAVCDRRCCDTGASSALSASEAPTRSTPSPPSPPSPSPGASASCSDEASAVRWYGPPNVSSAGAPPPRCFPCSISNHTN